MSDLTELERLIRERLDAAAALRSASRETLRRDMDERERRMAQFGLVARRLLNDAIRPRMLTLARLFADAHVSDDKTMPYQCVCSFDRTAEYPATTKLSIGVSPDCEIGNAVVAYNLEILPIFFEFERRDQAIVSLDNPDERGIVSWLDTKLLNFTDTYLQLQVIQQYQQDNMVVDPVCKMRINSMNAAASAEHGGKRYYFCVEDCHQKFLLEPARYVTVH